VDALPGIRPRDPDRVVRARAGLPGRALSAELARIRRVLCNPIRCEIVLALGAGPLSVDDLAIVVGRAPVATSQHLRVLRDLDVVEADAVGTARYYRLGRSPKSDGVRLALEAMVAAAR
jgi:DNA-binding transcriptional ArsR family regulator